MLTIELKTHEAAILEMIIGIYIHGHNVALLNDAKLPEGHTDKLTQEGIEDLTMAIKMVTDISNQLTIKLTDAVNQVEDAPRTSGIIVVPG